MPRPVRVNAEQLDTWPEVLALLFNLAMSWVFPVAVLGTYVGLCEYKNWDKPGSQCESHWSIVIGATGAAGGYMARNAMTSTIATRKKDQEMIKEAIERE
jgi:hypothetical protein